MARKVKTILIIAVIAALVSGIAIWQYLRTRTLYNTGYPDGNTGGNLYNAGLFCEDENVIYFANPDDNYRLYSMSRSGGDVKKLSDDTVSYINTDEHYIYYVRNNTSKADSFSFLHVNTNALCRLPKEGGKPKILDPDPSIYCSIVGNYIYYLHYDTKTATTLYRVKIDGKEKEQIDRTPYYCCCTENRFIYFNGLESDHNIYRYDTETGTRVQLLTANAWMPIVKDGIAYYMDADHNYRLVSQNISTQELTVITNDRVDCFTVYGDICIYQKNDRKEPALMRVNSDGTGREVIADGNFRHLNLIGSELYFRPFDEDTTVYHTDVLNLSYIGTFHPGVRVVKK